MGIEWMEFVEHQGENETVMSSSSHIKRNSRIISRGTKQTQICKREEMHTKPNQAQNV